MIRPAEVCDFPAILTLYQNARRFMAENGNPTQWGSSSPTEAQLREDLHSRCLYVRELNGTVCGVFAFLVGEDPTYRSIEGGQWGSDTPYGTIHRTAGDGIHPGMMAETVAFCAAIQPHLRVDTHENNRPMRRVVEACGFRYCGIIHVADGTPRLAYERMLCPEP